MSNETENKNETVLDLLEHEAQQFSNLVKEGWEHCIKVAGARGVPLHLIFKLYHKATTTTFAQTALDPQKMMTLVLGAVARDLINNMDEAQKAEFACITLDQLNYTHTRDDDAKEED